MSHRDHHARVAQPFGVAVITVSDTRTAETDTSGSMALRLLEDAGHEVRDYRILKDEPEQIRGAVDELASRPNIRAIILTGGTGISPRDRTYESLVNLFDRRLDGFGEIFRSISYEEIGPLAILSRAIAGIRGNTVIFSVPGTPAAVTLAIQRLILPALQHTIAEMDKT